MPYPVAEKGRGKFEPTETQRRPGENGDRLEFRCQKLKNAKSIWELEEAQKEILEEIWPCQCLDFVLLAFTSMRE